MSTTALPSSMQQQQYRSRQVFVGDGSAHQLSFGVGELMVLRPQQQQQDASPTTSQSHSIAAAATPQRWAFGILVRTGETGWFPETFVEPILWEDHQQHYHGPPSVAAPIVSTGAQIQQTLHHQNSTVDDMPVAVAIPIYPQEGHSTITQPVFSSTGHNSTTTAPPRDAKPGTWLSGQQQEETQQQQQPSNQNNSFTSNFGSGRNLAWAASKMGTGLTKAAKQTGSFFEKGLANAPALQPPSKTNQKNNSDHECHNNPTTPRSKTVTTTTERQGSSWLSFGNSSSTTTTTTIASPEKTTQVQTTRTLEGSSWSLFGGSSSSTTSTTTTTTTTRNDQNPTNHHCNSHTNYSAAERIAGSVGTVAAVSSAMNALQGNLKGALRAGTVSATALAVQGHLATAQNHPNSTSRK